MAVRYSEEIDFQATCVLSGLDGLAVARCQDGPRAIIVAAHDLIEAAREFVEFKFGFVPGCDGAFIWSTNGHWPESAQPVGNNDVQDDCDRFFRLLKHYERTCCA